MPARLSHSLEILSLGWHFALQRLKTDMAYPWDFISETAANMLYSVIQLFFFWTIFQHVPDIRGYSLPQIVLIWGLAELSWGWLSVLFLRTANSLADSYIVEANLDRVLIRPLPPLWQLLSENVNFQDLSVLLKGYVLIIWAMLHCGLPLGPGSLLLASLLGLAGGCILGAMHLLSAALAFWIKDRNGYNGLMFEFGEAVRYPMRIYPAGVRSFFTFVIPFAYTAAYPADYMLEHARRPGLLWELPLVLGLLGLAVSHVYNRGFKRYESAGS
ncbi:MAG: ABC-2 family transporter protein [bacterium]